MHTTEFIKLLSPETRRDIKKVPKKMDYIYAKREKSRTKTEEILDHLISNPKPI